MRGTQRKRRAPIPFWEDAEVSDARILKELRPDTAQLLDKLADTMPALCGSIAGPPLYRVEKESSVRRYTVMILGCHERMVLQRARLLKSGAPVEEVDELISLAKLLGALSREWLANRDPVTEHGRTDKANRRESGRKGGRSRECKKHRMLRNSCPCPAWPATAHKLNARFIASGQSLTAAQRARRIAGECGVSEKTAYNEITSRKAREKYARLYQVSGVPAQEEKSSI